MNPSSIGVLVVDDSLVVRLAARDLLVKHRDIRLIDTAPDPIAAMEIMKREWPDVIVLDLQMPRMDGLTFLKKLMAERPTPVVVCSTLVGNGAQAGLDALAAGAVSVISKPRSEVNEFFLDESDNIVAAVRAAAHTNLAQLKRMLNAPRASAESHPAAPPVAAGAASLGGERVIAIGASTGGTLALEALLPTLPADLPGIVMVQHMPVGFTRRFADRLDAMCALRVREAENGDLVGRGQVLLAPAGKQMRLQAAGVGFKVEVVDGPFINRHRPSVDCLFSSVARNAGKQAMGILMTGLGDDGALGMKEMFDKGALTVAEAEESCVVYGMPRAAVQRGGVRDVLPLDRIGQRLRQWAANGR